MMFLLLISCSTLSRVEESYEDFTTLEQHFEDHYISKHNGSLPLFYYTGGQWIRRLKELINQAEDYILFSLFLANIHEVTEEIWMLLIEKQQQGVEVYGIIDSSSNFQKVPGEPIHTPAALQMLKSNGVAIVEYNSITASKLFILPFLLDREHRKFWVFDGETISVGGMNINYTSLGHPPGIGHIDAMVEVQSPSAAAEIIHSFITTWNGYDPRQLHQSMFLIPEVPPDYDGTEFWLIDSSPGGQTHVDAMLDGVFFSAREEIWLVQGYAFSSRNLIHRIEEAVARGVEVHIVFSDHQWNPSRRGAAYYSKMDFLKAGASIYLFSSPEESFLHFKLILVDDTISVLGSVNYNNRSQYLSREVALVFEDPDVGKDVRQHLEELLLHTSPVTEEDAQSYRTFINRLHHLVMQLGG